MATIASTEESDLQVGQPDSDEQGETWHDLGRRGARAALQLTVRSILIRGLTLLGTLALARILVPADFGVFAIVSFIVSLWLTLGDFGLGAALVQQREEPTPRQLATAWTAQQAIALAAIAAIWLAAPAIAGLVPGLPSDAPWMLRVLALGLLLSSLRTLPSVMMERSLRFGPLATADIAGQVAYYVVAVGLAAAGFRAWSFVVAGVVQLAVGTVTVNLAWWHRPALGLDRSSLRRMIAFGFDYQLTVVLMALRDTPLPLMAGLIAGSVSAGLLQFATRIALTLASIDEVVGRIAFPAFSRLQGRKEEQARAVDSAILLTALFVVPIQCSMAVLAPVVVPALFGQQWIDAVVPIQLISLATLFRFPARYLRQAVFAEGASRRGLAIAAACLALAIPPIVPGLVWAGLPGAGVGFLIGALLGMAATVRLSQSYVRLNWLAFYRVVLVGLAAAGASALVLVGVLGMTADWQPAGVKLGGGLAVVASAAAYAASFAGLAWLFERRLLKLGFRVADQASGGMLSRRNRPDFVDNRP